MEMWIPLKTLEIISENCIQTHKMINRTEIDKTLMKNIIVEIWINTKVQ